MKFIKVTFLIFSLILGASLAAALRDIQSWEEFKTKFNKKYDSKEEEEHRLKVFLDNKEYVESHNTKSGVSFTQGINSLSDLTTEEINRSRNGFRWVRDRDDQPMDGLLQALLVALNSTADESARQTLINITEWNVDSRAWYEDILTPRNIDWRKTGRVSKVKDQGSCGSCWAFATTGALESVLASQNRSTLLSEQNLIDCSRRYGNFGCQGGLMDAALQYVRDFGIMSSHDYPYTGRNEQCKFRRDKSVMRVRSSATMPRGNEPLLRIAAALTGPIPIAIDASLRSFHSYKSGVFNDRACKSGKNDLNHAVLLVGYGTDRHLGDYWIIKNSWGTKWGDGGYIKIARNKRNLCGVASFAVLPVA